MKLFPVFRSLWEKGRNDGPKTLDGKVILVALVSSRKGLSPPPNSNRLGTVWPNLRLQEGIYEYQIQSKRPVWGTLLLSPQSLNNGHTIILSGNFLTPFGPSYFGSSPLYVHSRVSPIEVRLGVPSKPHIRYGISKGLVYQSVTDVRRNSCVFEGPLKLTKVIRLLSGDFFSGSMSRNLCLYVTSTLLDVSFPFSLGSRRPVPWLFQKI